MKCFPAVVCIIAVRAIVASAYDVRASPPPSPRVRSKKTSTNSLQVKTRLTPPPRCFLIATDRAPSLIYCLPISRTGTPKAANKLVVGSGHFYKSRQSPVSTAVIGTQRTWGAWEGGGLRRMPCVEPALFSQARSPSQLRHVTYSYYYDSSEQYSRCVQHGTSSMALAKSSKSKRRRLFSSVTARRASGCCFTPRPGVTTLRPPSPLRPCGGLTSRGVAVHVTGNHILRSHLQQKNK